MGLQTQWLINGANMRNKINQFAKNAGIKIVMFDTVFDSAIIGICETPICVAYNYKKMISILQQVLPYDDAVEYIEFNVIGAHGDGLPILINTDVI